MARPSSAARKGLEKHSVPAKTTITHPASTSHGRLSEDQRQAAGIVQGLVRVAVGLDDVEDVKADLLRGLQSL